MCETKLADDLPPVAGDRVCGSSTTTSPSPLTETRTSASETALLDAVTTVL